MDPLTIGAAAAGAIFLLGLLSWVRSDAADVRLLSKTVWLVIIVLLPVAGPLSWYVLGRPKLAYGRRIARGRAKPRWKKRKIKNDRKAAVERLTSDIRTPSRSGARARSGSSAGAGRPPAAGSPATPLMLGDSYAPMPPEAYVQPRTAASVPSPLDQVQPAAPVREPELVGRRAAGPAAGTDLKVRPTGSPRRGLVEDDDGDDW